MSWTIFSDIVVGDLSTVTLIGPPKKVQDYVKERLKLSSDLDIDIVEATDINGKRGVLSLRADT